MARYQPKRLDATLPNAAHGYEPRRLAGKAGAARAVLRRVPLVRILLVALALSLVAVMGGTAARYLKNWTDSSLATAENFYFTSDKLLGSDTPYHLTAEQDGNAHFAFTLQNYLVDAYPTPDRIAYTCEVTDEAGQKVSSTLKDGEAGDDGTLGGGSPQAVKKSLSCVIPASAFKKSDGTDQALTVTVRSSRPYVAQLTAKVSLAAGSDGIHWVVTDPGGDVRAVAVTLYNTNGQGRTGKLTWPSGGLELVPDATADTVPGADGSLTIPGGGAVSVVFLRKNMDSSFDEGDFNFQVTAVSP